MTAPQLNRLAGETSPYLLQHATNPVDWYPWGDEAFARARAENKPVLLSVGYSSCHWCHVMAHESFENPSIAAQLNEGFVSIKVDREERPDVDAVYMTATQALAGQGGWPMTVFLTPDGEPFYAGTYFPPDDRYGRPSFPSVLDAVTRAWTADREKVVASAGQITGRLREAAARIPDRESDLDANAPAAAVTRLSRSFDRAYGGWGRAPKFPSPALLDFLLMDARLRPNTTLEEPGALEMVLHTLSQMANGGIYDHLSGGFARYSTDTRWLVPHFEKMLYDNAQLARVYLHASLVAPNAEERVRYDVVTRETLDYLLREMVGTDGGFYSAQDADSEGVEGKFFVWTPAEVEAVLGADDAALFNAWYNVTTQGNFEDPHHTELGRSNVLSTHRPSVAVAAELGIAEGELRARLPALRARMLEARAQRVPPGFDDKMLASWNGLALAAFAEAGRVLRDQRYVEAARRGATFLREQMWRDGRLLHTYKDGVSRVDGMLEDYAFVGLGLVAMYRATGQLGHLEWAAQLLEELTARFFDEDSGTFFDTALDAEALLFRQRSLQDGPMPSGNAAAAQLAWWLGRYYERRDWEDLARGIAASTLSQLGEYPSAVGGALQVAELMLSPRRELAIVGSAESRAPLEAEAASRYLPALLLAPAPAGIGLPILEDRGVAKEAAAYLCEDMVCALPVTTTEALASQLEALG
ncbi:MAG: thioredoxin domain-containing protein [Dehalococcoidia bacterium]|nr:thioredoxin domain-containing protein [Dehalococcoidia bacterium]